MLLLFATYEARTGYTEMRTETDSYIELQQSADDLQLASDYLTEQVRCYAETGERIYMDNYFEEANVTMRREHALAALKKLSGRNKAYDSLAAAMKESVALMDREYYSMKLTSEVYGYKDSTLPEEVRNVELSKKDAALSIEEKDNLARAMVFDDEYHREKDLISSNMNDCLEELREQLRIQQTDTADAFGNLLRRQQLLIMIAITVTLLAMLFTLFLLVSPLLRAVMYIRADEPIPVTGSKEFRFLAQTYNVMYESNKEQKEKLAFDATHDHLTGLYNRSGYDFYLNNVNIDDSALIIIDADKFKDINDSKGHEFGDKILQKIATAIKSSFRAQDYVCRLGGDEFAVILVHINDEYSGVIEKKINLINNRLADTSDGLPYVQISAGAAFGKDVDADEMFRKADAALYKVKSNGGSGCVISD